MPDKRTEDIRKFIFKYTLETKKMICNIEKNNP